MTKDAERRKKENADLIQRMNGGDNLCHTDIKAFRWAPRPNIKKCDKEVARIFGKSEDK